MGEPRARAGRPGAVSQLPAACRAAEPGRAPHHAGPERHSGTARTVGIRHTLQRLIPHGLMLASGFAGLGYQIVWTQQAALWLGHEAAAVLAVVAAFFGGLAVGAFTFGPRIERSARPRRWYAWCEFVIAG